MIPIKDKYTMVLLIILNTSHPEPHEIQIKPKNT